ncbi:MAG TPA: DUF4180 domain-containing protein [Firmicutes bacterium]|nr:DUF4180 domain-containing protein [Bacillota bacterium]
MTIREAILAILSGGPYSGYDIKKIIKDSPFMPWKGNNNQVYKNLVALTRDGLLTKKTVHQDSAPAKIIYELNESGRDELKRWLISDAEVPEFKNFFLTRLACDDVLSRQELVEIINRYEEKVNNEIIRQKKLIRQRGHLFSASLKNQFLTEMIGENILSFYEKELSWIRKLKLHLTEQNPTEQNPMEQEGREVEKSRSYRLVEHNRGNYLEVFSWHRPVDNEQDALELITTGNENNTRNMMIYAQVLSPDFFQLKTGVAVKILQKFIDYRVRVAIIIAKHSYENGGFLKMAADAGKDFQFRIFDNREKAENWLLETKDQA